MSNQQSRRVLSEQQQSLFQVQMRVLKGVAVFEKAINGVQQLEPRHGWHPIGPTYQYTAADINAASLKCQKKEEGKKDDEDDDKTPLDRARAFFQRIKVNTLKMFEDNDIEAEIRLVSFVIDEVVLSTDTSLNIPTGARASLAATE